MCTTCPIGAVKARMLSWRDPFRGVGAALVVGAHRSGAGVLALV